MTMKAMGTATKAPRTTKMEGTGMAREKATGSKSLESFPFFENVTTRSVDLRSYRMLG